ncbi:MAG: hypothetical protein J6R89_00495 [Clostridia bacterium]|nr:hypothetical protein [Clostridia bacterium]
MIPIIIQAPLSFAIPAIILTTSEALIYKTPVTKRMIVELVLSLACTLLFVL